ncbi:MAG: hypothetical protein ACYDDA_14250 [Acidiferrobacteraceae bacterium]
MKRTVTVLVVLFSMVRLSMASMVDPTRPNFGTNVRPGYRLESVLVSPMRRTAMINGRRLAVGDRIGRARVVHIDDRGVQLMRDGRIVRLHLIHGTGHRTFDLHANREGGS